MVKYADAMNLKMPTRVSRTLRIHFFAQHFARTATLYIYTTTSKCVFHFPSLFLFVDFLNL